MDRGLVAAFLFLGGVFMHIPDGFLEAKTWLTTAAVSTGILGYSVMKTKQELNDRQIPKLGVMAAFIFAAQMIIRWLAVPPDTYWEPHWPRYYWVPGVLLWFFPRYSLFNAWFFKMVV